MEAVINALAVKHCRSPFFDNGRMWKVQLRATFATEYICGGFDLIRKSFCHRRKSVGIGCIIYKLT